MLAGGPEEQCIRRAGSDCWFPPGRWERSEGRGRRETRTWLIWALTSASFILPRREDCAQGHRHA